MVLAIISILASITYPQYTKYIVRVRRNDAHSSLLNLAIRMEQFYVKNFSYKNAKINQNQSTEGWYNLSILHASDTAYTLQATAIGAQAIADTNCTTLTLNNLGSKNASSNNTFTIPNSECW